MKNNDLIKVEKDALGFTHVYYTYDIKFTDKDISQEKAIEDTKQFFKRLEGE